VSRLNILLTTPESLEALLISRRTDRFFFFGSVRSIIVDEIHAFAGDDRGWHLLAVLERIRHITKLDMQRIGLSATVSNPEKLLHWLAGGSTRDSVLVSLPGAPAADAEVTIDFVGNLRNAARVLRILHRGEKLVFCDSRARTEELATHLRAEDVSTFVSHSSLSVEQRRDAEAAFREARDCVIVATSTLELGIDVGDLDRVIQLDAPGTVSSFLQRLGRTGRRADTRRNCLFLTTSRTALLQASALVLLWREGYVEPLAPPPKPLHVVAQQLMTLALQQGGIGRSAWREWLLRLLPSMQITGEDVKGTLEYMLSRQILVEDGTILGMGPEGEHLYGGKNYMALLSVFRHTARIHGVLWAEGLEFGASAIVPAAGWRTHDPLAGRPCLAGHSRRLRAQDGPGGSLRTLRPFALARRESATQLPHVPGHPANPPRRRASRGMVQACTG
jgi:ATP-dependent Lhr-like helicase